MSVYCFEGHGEHPFPENVAYCESLRARYDDYGMASLMNTIFGLVPAGQGIQGTAEEEDWTSRLSWLSAWRTRWRGGKWKESALEQEQLECFGKIEEERRGS